MKPPSPAIAQWSTDAVPPKQRFAYYEDALAHAVVPLRISSPDPESLSTEITMAAAGPVSFLRMSGTGHRAHRGVREISRSSERTYHLLVNLVSAWTLTHRGWARLAPGDAVLTDSAFDHELDYPTSYDVIHLKLSEAWLRQWMPSPAVLTGRRIPADAGWARGLTSFVSRLSPQFVVDSPLPVSVVADHVGALLALIGHELGTPAERPTRSARALHDRIRDLIVQQCATPSLMAQDIATRLGISTRTLHRTLASFGQTFGAALMAARVVTATRMLESPLCRRLSVAEIGRRSGFLDASHFTRVLRARTGSTPSQWRRDGTAAADESLHLAGTR